MACCRKVPTYLLRWLILIDIAKAFRDNSFVHKNQNLVWPTGKTFLRFCLPVFLKGLPPQRIGCAIPIKLCEGCRFQPHDALSVKESSLKLATFQCISTFQFLTRLYQLSDFDMIVFFLCFSCCRTDMRRGTAFGNSKVPPEWIDDWSTAIFGPFMRY